MGQGIKQFFYPHLTQDFRLVDVIIDFLLSITASGTLWIEASVCTG